jgi:aspartate/methionine/tyrosine aminotransferase
LPLRQALSEWLAERNGLAADPETEMVITAGGN